MKIDQPSDKANEGHRNGRWVPIAGWFLFYLFLAGTLQLSIPYPFDTDTAYHAAVGHLIRERGFLHAFPWTPFSWLADHYADKELLFHLLFVPLDGMDWTVSARIVGTVVGAITLFIFFIVLRAEGVKLAGVWALIPLAASSIFVIRFSLVRPHLMSIPLAFLVLWSAARGRLVLLAVVSAIYPWAYVAFWQLPLILLVAAEGAHLLSGGRLRWKPGTAVLAGILLGWALHPNAWNLLKFNWIVTADVLFQAAWQSRGGIELGLEFLPFTAAQWAKWLLACTLLFAAGLVLAWRDRKSDPTPLAFALAALVFGLFTLRTARFVEYFAPFSVAALAIAVRSYSWRFTAPAVLAVSAIYTGLFGSDTLVSLTRRPDDMPSNTAVALQQRIPPGSQVFTPEWEFTGILMLTLPERRFIVALDPTLFYVKDADLYRLWYSLPRKAPPETVDIIRRRFGARYVLCSNYPGWGSFFTRLISSPGVKMVLITDLWVLFDLDGHPGV